MKKLVVVLAIACMAPTPGDVGGCGSEATSLDQAAFGLERKSEDCVRCRECSLATTRCTNACDANVAPDTAFPKTCEPLEHDGRVCIRALAAASCDDYATYVTDSPSLPSECQFCKLGGDLVVTPPASFAAPDASADGGTP